MELFSYDPNEIDSGDVLVAELDGNEVFRAPHGAMFMRKPNGYVYKLNATEQKDPNAFLQKVKKFNL